MYKILTSKDFENKLALKKISIFVFREVEGEFFNVPRRHLK